MDLLRSFFGRFSGSPWQRLAQWARKSWHTRRPKEYVEYVPPNAYRVPWPAAYTVTCRLLAAFEYDWETCRRDVSIWCARCAASFSFDQINAVGAMQVAPIVIGFTSNPAAMRSPARKLFNRDVERWRCPHCWCARIVFAWAGDRESMPKFRAAFSSLGDNNGE